MINSLILKTWILVGFFALIYFLFLLLPPISELREIDSYLPLHTIMETFSVIVSCMIFGIIWNTCDADRPRNLTILGVAFLSVGLLDFAHLMSYDGMPDFITPSSPQKGIVFWLAARFVLASAMLVSATLTWRPFKSPQGRYRLLALFLTITALTYWVELWHPTWVPLFWDEQSGLTPAKQIAEYVVMTMYAVSAVLFYRVSTKARMHFDCRGLCPAASVIVISELCFTSYSSVTDAFNLLGHIYKIVAYLFLYRVLFEQLVRDPYAKLKLSRQAMHREKERAEVTLHSIMDGVITTNANGIVTSLNTVASQLTGFSNEAASGRPLAEVFKVFDETDHSPIENPIDRCLREQRAILLANHAMIVSAFGTTYSIEQLASPIIDKDGSIIGVVMVFRDVTEHRRIRDNLVRQEKKLSQAQAIAHLGNWEWDLSSNQMNWSDEMFRIVGMTPKSRQPDYISFASLLYCEDRDKVLTALGDIAKNLEPIEMEYRIVRIDGAIRYIQASIHVQTNEASKPIAIFGTLLDITERKNTEKQLLRSKAKIEDLYENAPCGYHSLDSDGVIRKINRTELDWLGYESEELVGKVRFIDLISDEDVKVFQENFARFKREGSVQDLEFEMIRKDGSHFFVSVNATAIYDEQGHYIASRSTLNDITERKKVQQSLAEKEQNLSKAQAIAHMGSWEWDIESGRQSWSDERFRILGLEPGSIVTNYDAFLDFIVEEDRTFFITEIQKALDTSSTYRCEFRIRRPDGEIRHILGQGETVLSADGKPIQMTGTTLDITERKLAEYELKKNQLELQHQSNILRAILDALPANLALLDNDGIIIAVNKRWEDFARQNGLSLQQFGVGTNYPKACYNATCLNSEIQSTIDGLKNVLSGQSPQFVNEYDCHAPDQQRWYRMIAVPLSTEEQLGAVVMHLDITESWQNKTEIEALNRQLEQRVKERTAQLEAANKELEAFSYSVSHDLRAPLRAIDGFSHMLSVDYGDSMDEKARRYLDRIQNAAKRMAELIDDLLQLSRVNRGELRFVEVDLSKMAQEILADLKQREPERKAEFLIAPDCRIFGDSQLLKIVLENLLANAWKFTRHREPTIIELGFYRSNEQTVYFVRDNGAGFNPKYTHKLFGAFQRLHSEDEFEGTGVGLATVQRIISRHNGSVWAESIPDEGATFFFKL